MSDAGRADNMNLSDDSIPDKTFSDAVLSFPSADPPLLALPLPKFCRGCGTAWQADWLECPSCAPRNGSPAATMLHDAQRQKSSISFALALYFTLLGASVIGICGMAGGAPVVRVILAVTVVHSLIVLGFLLGPRRGDVFAAVIKPFHPGWLGGAILMAVGTFLAATASIAFQQRLFHIVEIKSGGDLFSAGYGWFAVISAICIQPAIFEELAFRGVILSALGKALAASEAVIVSALFFMTLHLTIGSFPHLFLIGLGLGYLRIRTGSLVPGMLMHFTHNLLCVLAEQMTGSKTWW